MELAVPLCVPALCRLTPWMAANWRLRSVLVGLNEQKRAFDFHRKRVVSSAEAQIL